MNFRKKYLDFRVRLATRMLERITRTLYTNGENKSEYFLFHKENAENGTTFLSTKLFRTEEEFLDSRKHAKRLTEELEYIPVLFDYEAT